MFQVEPKKIYTVQKYIDESDGFWKEDGLYAFRVFAWFEKVDSEGISLIPCCACVDGRLRPEYIDPGIFEFVGFFESLPEGTQEITFDNELLNL